MCVPKMAQINISLRISNFIFPAMKSGFREGYPPGVYLLWISAVLIHLCLRLWMESGGAREMQACTTKGASHPRMRRVWARSAPVGARPTLWRWGTVCSDYRRKALREGYTPRGLVAGPARDPTAARRCRGQSSASVHATPQGFRSASGVSNIVET